VRLKSQFIDGTSTDIGKMRPFNENQFQKLFVRGEAAIVKHLAFGGKLGDPAHCSGSAFTIINSIEEKCRDLRPKSQFFTAQSCLRAAPPRETSII
jgi:hypothetical protein